MFVNCVSLGKHLTLSGSQFSSLNVKTVMLAGHRGDPVTPELEMRRQEDCTFEATLGSLLLLPVRIEAWASCTKADYFTMKLYRQP